MYVWPQSRVWESFTDNGGSQELEEADTRKSPKTHARETPVASRRGEVTQRKPDVSNIVCAAGKTQHSLCTQQWLYCALSKDQHGRCDFDLLTPK